MLHELLTIPQMWRHLRYPRSQLAEYQSKQLRLVVTTAYDRIPYYRRLFDGAGIKPQDIRTAADLEAIPITSKAILHSTPAEDFVARGFDHAKLIVRTSGGSTGEPVRIRRTWFEERLLNTFRFRACHALGIRATDHQASISLFQGEQKADRQMLSQLMHHLGLFRHTRLDVLSPTDELVESLLQIKPDVIIGYAGAVALVAQKLIDMGNTTLRPRLVGTGSEVLLPLMREQISRAFAAPVCDFYGANEFNLVGWECLQTGQLHTCDDAAIIEIVRNGKPVNVGQRGEVVGTALHSFAMPVIRFSLNDVATRGPDACPCGAPFSTISALQGRMIDYFPLPDGRLIHPFEFFGRIMHDRAEWMRQYQIIQERQDLVVLRAVLSKQPTNERLAEMRAQAAQLLGPGVEFRIEFLPKLDSESNGKFRAVRSMVRSAYDQIDWEKVS